MHCPPGPLLLALGPRFLLLLTLLPRQPLPRRLCSIGRVAEPPLDVSSQAVQVAVASAGLAAEGDEPNAGTSQQQGEEERCNGQGELSERRT